MAAVHPLRFNQWQRTDTRDVKATVRQIRGLERAGCEIIRVAVLNRDAVCKLGRIKKKINIPLVSDIHFDYRLAIESIRQGVDKIRINPGNIRDSSYIRRIAKAAKERGIPIRIGVNSGSIEKKLLLKYKGPVPRAMVESALKNISLFEKEKFYDTVISLKAPDVRVAVESYQMLAEKCDYPFHLGITAAGPFFSGMVRSSVGIGSLLLQGIGDTIRASLTAPPGEEVRLGYKILESTGVRITGPQIISCPICGRCEIDLLGLTKKVEKEIKKIKKPVKIAIMGCVVNGPGEAREADIGVAGGKGVGILFKKGKIIKKVPEKKIFTVLMKELKEINKKA